MGETQTTCYIDNLPASLYSGKFGSPVEQYAWGRRGGGSSFYDLEMLEIQFKRVSRGVMSSCERNFTMPISIGNQKGFCFVGAQGAERGLGKDVWEEGHVLEVVT